LSVVLIKPYADSSGLTDTLSIYAVYERMRQADGTKDSILPLVECQTAQQFREVLSPLRIRHSSEWRFLDQEQNDVTEDR